MSASGAAEEKIAIPCQPAAVLSVRGSLTVAQSTHETFVHNPIHSHPCDQLFFLVRNKQRLRSKFLEGDIRCQAERCFHGDCCVMIKRTALILSTATLSFGLALASIALADDAMKKDTMSKDSMSNDTMSKDKMSKDTMSKDSMKNDEMKKN